MRKAIAASARGHEDARGRLIRFSQWLSVLVRGGRQMCGIPDYQAYLAHQRRHHPGQPLLSYEAFFRERIDARYGGRNGKIRCC